MRQHRATPMTRGLRDDRLDPLLGPEPYRCRVLAVVVALLVLTVQRPGAQESADLTKVQLRMIAVGALATAAVTVAALAANPPNFGHPGHEHGAHSSHP